jgi:outer membrane receptor protein involved in Fe transport
LSSSVEFREVRGFSEELGFLGGLQTTMSRSGGRESTVAFFAQDMWRMSRRATVNLGVRYDRWENRDALAESRVLATGVLTTTLFPDRSEGTFSPRIAAMVEANDRVSFYGSYSRSFRAPTLNELYRGFRVGNVVTLANENLRAETADTFEGGVTFSALRKRLAIRSNVYVTTVVDPIVSVTLATTPTLITRQRQNLGKTRSRGVEADVEFAPIPELRLAASYLFVDARVTEFPANVALVGNFLPQVARHQLNLRVNYRPNSRWSFGVQSRMSSGQYEDDVNMLRLSPYLTVDTTSAIRVRRGVEVFFTAENVFNSRYDIGLTPNRTIAAPASLRLGLRFDLTKR